MSIPICVCRPIALAKGEGTDAEFESFAQDMAYNKHCGHWSTVGCRHIPVCTAPSQEQQDAFNVKLTARIAEKINRPPPPMSKEEQKAHDRKVRESFKTFRVPLILGAENLPILSEILSVQPMAPTAETNRLAEKAWGMKPGTLGDPDKLP